MGILALNIKSETAGAHIPTGRCLSYATTCHLNKPLSMMNPTWSDRSRKQVKRLLWSGERERERERERETDRERERERKKKVTSKKPKGGGGRDTNKSPMTEQQRFWSIIIVLSTGGLLEEVTLWYFMRFWGWWTLMVMIDRIYLYNAYIWYMLFYIFNIL